MRVQAPLLMIHNNREFYITPEGKLCRAQENAYSVTKKDLKETLEYMSDYSLYAFEEEVRQGFITIQGGHRIGIAGKTIVVYEYVYIEKNSNGSGQWVLIADHEDFEDENQRAYLPYIDTLAFDEKTRNHISNAEKGLKNRLVQCRKQVRCRPDRKITVQFFVSVVYIMPINNITKKVCYLLKTDYVLS